MVISSGYFAASPTDGRLRSLKRLILNASFGFLVVFIGVATGLTSASTMLWATLVAFLFLLPILWNRPALGAYLLVGGAAVFETFPLNFADSITDQTIFFRTVKSAGGPSFLLINGAEAVMVSTLVIVALRRMAVGGKPLELGPMFWAVAFYTMMVGFGLVNGIGRGGGDIEIALFEVRGQVYLLLAYLLVVNTIHESRQVKRLLWVFLAGVALKGLLGSWRLLVTLGGNVDNLPTLGRNANSFLSHEESYLFALFFLLALILFLFRSHRGQIWFVILAAPPALLSLLANERRAGFLALMIGVVVAIFLAYVLVQSRRKAILVAGILTAVLFSTYIGLSWNSAGLVGQPARSVKSLLDPNNRDANSDSFRGIEGLNLKYNIQIDPLLGRGYGTTIIFYIPQPFIGNLFYYWDIIPHNTILWIWMRLGVVGFSAFWFLVGRSLLASIMVTKRLSDPYLQSVGVFGVVALVTWVFMGMVDMGIVDFRQTILIGSLIGLVSRLPAMESGEPSSTPTGHPADHLA